MQTIITPGIYEALNLIIKYYPDKFTEEAKAEIETLLEHCLKGHHDDSEKFLSTLFLKALKKHVGNISIDEHIYLKKYEMPQIQLFNILIKDFPFVKYSHEITNSIIAEHIVGKEHAIVIDIGVGQGVQINSLLKKINGNAGLKKLYVIGIEVIPDALDIAYKSIHEAAQHLPFEVEFIALHAFIENFDFENLNELIKRLKGEVIINASLTLHHVQNLQDRSRVIEQIYKLKPALFLMTEPNVDHYEPNFYRRFHNCYQHFHHVFQVIDNLPIASNDKNGLKLFFGREIEDIIGSGGNDERYEKHEPAYRWVEKLRNSGFFVNNCFAEFENQHFDGVRVHYEPEGYLGFTYNAETVLSIISATT